MEKIKLFCIPHAGASAYYYIPLNNNMTDVEFEFVELKGRGKRLDEELYTSFDEAVDDIFNQIKEKCNNNYAIFGHSMGSLLAYEVYYKLLRNNFPMPKYMFFSSKEAPYEKVKKIDVDNMNDNDLEQFIKNLGGFDDLENVNPKMKKIFYRIIRSDFKILNDYEFHEPPEKINCKVVVMAGNKERNFSYSHLCNWQKVVESEISYYSFDGNHFYMKNQWHKFAKVIEENMKKG